MDEMHLAVVNKYCANGDT